MLVQIGHLAILFSVMTAAPLCVLPQKDTIEELFFKERGMSTKTNAFVTVLLVALCFGLSLLIQTIGDAMTLVGSSINPLIGFILPVLFSWPLMKD